MCAIAYNSVDSADCETGRNEGRKMKGLSKLATAFVLVFNALGTASAVEPIDATDAYNMLDPYNDRYEPNAYILDVRTPSEWYWVGHPGEAADTNAGEFLEGKVVNIPFWFWEYDRKTDAYVLRDNVNKFFDAEVVRRFNPGDTLILMCRSGGRASLAGDELEGPSQPASQRLEELGSYYVYNMKGGFESVDKEDGTLGWKLSNLPFNKSAVGIWKPSDQQGRSLK